MTRGTEVQKEEEHLLHLRTPAKEEEEAEEEEAVEEGATLETSLPPPPGRGRKS